MTIKTDVSRFHIHDELTAPEGSVKILKGVQGAAGEISKFVGVLAGAPAALRAYARMRHELRSGVLPQATRERIALAVAQRRGDSYSIAQHARTARAAGLGIDEVTRARQFRSGDPKEQRCSSSSRRCSRATDARTSTWARRHASMTGPTRSCSRPWRRWR